MERRGSVTIGVGNSAPGDDEGRPISDVRQLKKGAPEEPGEPTVRRPPPLQTLQKARQSPVELPEDDLGPASDASSSRLPSSEALTPHIGGTLVGANLVTRLERPKSQEAGPQAAAEARKDAPLQGPDSQAVTARRPTTLASPIHPSPPPQVPRPGSLAPPGGSVPPVSLPTRRVPAAASHPPSGPPEAHAGASLPPAGASLPPAAHPAPPRAPRPSLPSRSGDELRVAVRPAVPLPTFEADDPLRAGAGLPATSQLTAAERAELAQLRADNERLAAQASARLRVQLALGSGVAVVALVVGLALGTTVEGESEDANHPATPTLAEGSAPSPGAQALLEKERSLVELERRLKSQEAALGSAVPERGAPPMGRTELATPRSAASTQASSNDKLTIAPLAAQAAAKNGSPRTQGDEGRTGTSASSSADTAAPRRSASAEASPDSGASAEGESAQSKNGEGEAARGAAADASSPDASDTTSRDGEATDASPPKAKATPEHSEAAAPSSDRPTSSTFDTPSATDEAP